MVDNKELLANDFISSIKNKISDITKNENSLKDIVNYNMSNNENIYNIENTSLNLSKLNNLDLEDNNKQKENKFNKPIKSDLDDLYTKSLIEELSYNKDKNKIKFNGENNNENKKEDDYNKNFKNRMDMMQAILDDEMNVSSDNKSLISRRRPSKKTTQQENNRIYNLKLSTAIEKEKEKEIEKIKNEKEESKENIINLKDDIFSENKNINNNNFIDEGNINKEKNSFETPKKNKDTNNLINAQRNSNKIIDEINFEIFNNKENKKMKNPYIDINLNNKNKIKSENNNNKEKSKYSEIINDKNKTQNINKNKVKSNFTNNYININEYENKIKNRNKSKTAIPLERRNIYFRQFNKNNKNKNNRRQYFNYSKNKFSESLENLIYKIKDTCENKGKIKSNNNDLNKKIQDIKDSLQKMNDINKERDKINFMKTNINIWPISFNSKYNFENEYQINKNISRNYIFEKRSDSSDFIFYNRFNKRKIEYNISSPSKRNIKKIQSYSYMNTLNNSSNKNNSKNKNIYNINNFNINSLQLINKNIKLKNALEELQSSSNSKNNNFFDTNTKNYAKDLSSNKRKIINDNDNDNEKIGLYFTSEKREDKYSPSNKLHKINSSKFRYNLNKTNEFHLFDYNDNLKMNKKEVNIFFVNKRNKINNKQRFLIHKSDDNIKKNYFAFKPKVKYTPLKNNKNIAYKNDKSLKMQNYSQRFKNNYVKYTDFNKKNQKNVLSPLEKLREKNIHSIFPVNPFDTFNYIKQTNFFK